MDSLREHNDDICGILSCYDRMVLQGTLTGVCYAEGMTHFLRGQDIRVFDYARHFALPLAEEVKANAQRLAQKNLEGLGLSSRVVFRVRDVAEGFDETDADWEYDERLGGGAWA